MRTTPRAIAVLTASAVAATLLLAGCSGTTSSGPQVVTMWARGSDSGFLPGLVKLFNKENPKIDLKLTLVPDPQVSQKFSTAASTGSGPDIASIAIDQLPQYTSSGWLQDISKDITTLPYKDKLSPAHLSQGTIGKKMYGVPMSADVSVLYWNKTLFKQAGLDPNKAPTTWAEILSDAQAVRKLGGDNYGYFFSGGCSGCLGFTMIPYLWANGGDFFSKSSGKSLPHLSPNPKLGKVLQFYRTIWQDGLAPDTAKTENGTNQFAAFFSGKIGMFVQGTYPYSQLVKNKSVDFGVTPVPSTDGTSAAAFAGGDDLTLTKKADHAAGMTVLKWFMNQGQKSLAKQGILPIRSDIANQDYVPQDPRNAVFVKALQVGHTPYYTKLAALYDTNGPFTGLVDSAIFGTGSISADLDKAQTAAAALDQ